MTVKAIMWCAIAYDDLRSECALKCIWLEWKVACHVFERACGFLSVDLHSMKFDSYSAILLYFLIYIRFHIKENTDPKLFVYL